MIRQVAYLEAWDWNVVVYYDVTGDDAAIVLQALRKFGASGKDVKAAEGLFAKDMADSGLTLTDTRRRRSMVVIGRTSTAAEFANTYSHEKGHVAAHIAQAYGLDPFGEDYQYLTGDLGAATFPVASRFLCENCLKKLHGNG